MPSLRGGGGRVIQQRWLRHRPLQWSKAMGIRMGAPWFQIRHLEEDGLVALSANFELYGDMSDRMMSLLAGLGHRQEIYSIDECFVDLSGIRVT